VSERQGLWGTLKKKYEGKKNRGEAPKMSATLKERRSEQTGKILLNGGERLTLCYQEFGETVYH